MEFKRSVIILVEKDKVNLKVLEIAGVTDTF